jgi:hypothetical protein
MPQVTNSPDEDVVEAVVEHLNPYPFRVVVKTAHTHVDTPGVGQTRVACDLHRLVRSEVEYADYPNFQHPPCEALNKGANCVDATGLLCSMLIRAGFTCRIALITQTTRGHMFPEVLVEGPLRAIRRDIRSYYENRDRHPPETIAYDRADDLERYWIVADPATDTYLGRTTGLCQLGYVERTQDGPPRFNGTVQRFELNYKRR